MYGFDILLFFSIMHWFLILYCERLHPLLPYKKPSCRQDGAVHTAV